MKNSSDSQCSLFIEKNFFVTVTKKWLVLLDTSIPAELTYVLFLLLHCTVWNKLYLRPLQVCNILVNILYFPLVRECDFLLAAFAKHMSDRLSTLPIQTWDFICWLSAY